MDPQEQQAYEVYAALALRKGAACKYCRCSSHCEVGPDSDFYEASLVARDWQ